MVSSLQDLQFYMFSPFSQLTSLLIQFSFHFLHLSHGTSSFFNFCHIIFCLVSPFCPPFLVTEFLSWIRSPFLLAWFIFSDGHFERQMLFLGSECQLSWHRKIFSGDHIVPGILSVGSSGRLSCVAFFFV